MLNTGKALVPQRPRAEQDRIKRRLPELIDLESIVSKLRSRGRIHIETTVSHENVHLPIYSLEFGPTDPSAPVCIFIGGVHGLERIGSRVIIEFLKTFKELLYWDDLLNYLLERCRVLFYPMVNPIGIFARTRSNGQGVDIMRNAPIESPEAGRYSLVAGHRISRYLPWYRGRSNDHMELETAALCSFIRRNVMSAPFAVSLDVHSGFGVVDRLWFPYAKSENPIEHYVEMYALKRKLDQALPNHVYHIEPQSHQYVTHGDVWDYLYLDYLEKNNQGIYLPMTLEMGSWNWLKKNPRNIFNRMGAFHPLKPHRTQRILRRHIMLIDFLIRASLSYKKWTQPPPAKGVSYASDARRLWYDRI